MKDNIIKKCYLSAFDVNDKNLRDLIIVNTKCLVDDGKNRCVFVDVNRLKDELIYFKFYGEALSYNSILNLILPVILANTNIDRSQDESISLIQKYAKYFKKEIKMFDFILSAVIYNGVIHSLIENKNIEYEELLQSAKERIIGLAINLEKPQMIKFQMSRINTLQIIDKFIDGKYEDYDDNNIVSTILNILYDIYIEDRQPVNDGIMSIKKSILSILGVESDLNIENIDFINSMSEYITKLRLYKINKKIYDKTSDPRSLIKLNENDVYVDPIFNQIQVVSKEFSENILSVKIKAKSGIYTLKFKKS
ncbi:hypothetical protein [Romboutsia sp. Marseille-P6047]|uniref:hypothetical protein n=1 Tax=Romboutsia sp. Marseille-P6047 TaxID=2161817 RepID=UPI0008226754|nr:hypothetical protein [Romboutsia sp. Marseille-P6047]SCH99909.1 Uncharacterised protein [uncultured Clostridium sp.]